MIDFFKEEKMFHLVSENISYVFYVHETGHLCHLYYGERLNNPLKVDDFLEAMPKELGTSTLYDDESKLNLNNTLLEIATFGKGDYKEPTVHLITEEGFRSLDFLYQDYKIIKNHTLNDLPEAQKEQTLCITLKDTNFDVTLNLYYTLEDDVLVRNLEIINGKMSHLSLDKALSANFDFFHDDFSLITLDGDWLRERHINKRPLFPGIVKIDSKRGNSSNNHNPFIALMHHDATKEAGDVYGFNLIYSGNFEANIEVSSHEILRLNMGINSFDFSWKLAPNERFVTPEVVSTFSKKGLIGLQQNMHNFIQKKLTKNHDERWIVLNNWEATYFDFTTKKILKMAKKAKALGIECFVLDDGWFKGRDDDTVGLGDWSEHPKKLKKGLAFLSQKIHDMGLKFGIWVEPEMVNPKSDLYKNHPDWAIQHPKVRPALGRHQLVLDLSKQEVVDYLFETLSHVFSKANVDYVKWDMNRNMSDLFSQTRTKAEQLKLAHTYYLGLYTLLKKLKARFPHIIFESCASGGNRFDLGMHYYMPQSWTSDNTDAHERLSIQRGSLLAYPLNVISNHVNDEVAHQTIRMHSLDHRFNVACFGILGYELDVTKLSYLDRKRIKEHILYYKKHRKLLQYGTFYDLSEDDNDYRFLVVSEKQDEAILGLFQGLNKPNPTPQSIKVKGLKKESFYSVSNRPQKESLKRFGGLLKHALPIKIKAHSTLFHWLSNLYRLPMEETAFKETGQALMVKGLRLPYRFTGTGYDPKLRLLLDFSSRLYYMKEVNNGQT